ncbi:glucoamylase family protein [Tunturiibacter lichenicola]|uniref:glucoamylase family protein n=1 Tax=Tunturiibacter lichenicola TaxID=2051959 RepID=UPI003D9BB24F
MSADKSSDDIESLTSRRRLLRQMAGISLALPFAQWKTLPVWAQATAQRADRRGKEPASLPPPTALSPEDDKFLDDLERSSFLFFWEQANPQTGLIKDRCNVHINDTGIVASIASTGFGLSAICIAEKRGYISHQDARLRVIATLVFLWRKLPTHRGFFYHFANINTGERIWDSEVSSVDTALLLCGILTCRQHFQDRDIVDLAHAIFDRVDWTWLSEDTTLLPHGWTPELGFIPYKWDYYSELMMIYLLGMGSSSHPLRPEAWLAWKRTAFEYDGLRYIGSFAPLFVHQYSQAWFDFRGKRDKYADYFQNSTTATEVHRRFCVELSKSFPDYSDDLWGISASDSDKGYVIWGGPPAMGPIDGTVVPAAPGGSLPFLPEATLRVLKNIRAHYPQAWSRYGFVDAFNPLKKWYDTDIVGIDTGITMLMAENARTAFVWETFMKNPEAQRGMTNAGFKSYNPT